MTIKTLKKISTNVAIYGGLMALGLFAGQQMGQVVTGHSFVAHALDEVNTASESTKLQQTAEGIGPCNCPLCCHPA